MTEAPRAAKVYLVGALDRAIRELLTMRARAAAGVGVMWCSSR